MIELSLYAIAALLIIFLVYILVRRPHSVTLVEASNGDYQAQYLSNEAWLTFSQRIFDPSDCLWLRDELGFKHLADALACSRKQTALSWLRALKASFTELVHTPESAPADAEAANAPGSWQLLWLSLRFHFLLTYAITVVRLFGPYHRLIPSFRFIRLSNLPDPRKISLGPVGLGKQP
jgi:hypothetical protein